MRLFNKITIIGVGLIGGSIGLAVKKRGLAKEVAGIFRREVSLKAALRKKAVDTGTMDYREGLEGADLVVIATPVDRIPAIAKKVSLSVDHKIILTDAGSTKTLITTKVEKNIGRHVRFVGSHPMAGSEKTSVRFAEASLFEGSVCIMTRNGRTDAAALGKVKKFWMGLGAGCRIMTPGQHDHYISFISHLPHLAAMALALTAVPGSLPYASGGFKDTTRIASSDPMLWHDIFMSNRAFIIKALSRYKRDLGRIEKAIRRGDSAKLVAILKRSKAIRDTII